MRRRYFSIVSAEMRIMYDNSPSVISIANKLLEQEGSDWKGGESLMRIICLGGGPKRTPQKGGSSIFLPHRREKRTHRRKRKGNIYFLFPILREGGKSEEERGCRGRSALIPREGGS